MYAHNPAGLQALGDLIHKLRPQHRRVIGAVSIPGDRRNEDIDAMGRLAATLFDQIVFREKPDGRGREPGEVCRRLRDGALAAGISADALHCIPGETAAMEYCLRQAGPGDLVVLLPTEVTAAWDHLATDIDVMHQSKLLKVFVESYCNNSRELDLGHLIDGSFRSFSGLLKWRG